MFQYVFVHECYAKVNRPAAAGNLVFWRCTGGTVFWRCTGGTVGAVPGVLFVRAVPGVLFFLFALSPCPPVTFPSVFLSLFSTKQETFYLNHRFLEGMKTIEME